MYLHIGKDTLIDTNGIIAILNIETLEKKENLENVCKNINISDKIIDVSEKNKKSHSSSNWEVQITNNNSRKK